MPIIDVSATIISYRHPIISGLLNTIASNMLDPCLNVTQEQPNQLVNEIVSDLPGTLGTHKMEADAMIPETGPLASPHNVIDGNTTLIFQDEYLEVFFREAPAHFTLVTFSPFGIYANGSHYWAQNIAEKLNLRTIGIISRGNTWYPELSMGPCLEAIQPLLSGRIVVYGSSMGAYAAIKYSSRLHADTVIAFSPQTTISPFEFPDNTYRHFFKKELHQGMTIQSVDLGGRVYVFYDPYYDEDRCHVELMPKSPKVQTVEVPRLRHHTNLVSIGTNAMSQLLEGCLSRNDEVIKKLIKTAKRNVSSAYESLALYLQEHGKKKWARQALAKAEAAAPSRDRTERVFFGWSAIAERNQAPQEGIAILREAIDIIGDSGLLWRELGAMLSRASSFAEAADAFENAVNLEPHIPAVYHGYAHALLMCGRRTEALSVVKRGINECTEDTSLLDLYKHLFNQDEV